LDRESGDKTFWAEFQYFLPRSSLTGPKKKKTMMLGDAKPDDAAAASNDEAAFIATQQHNHSWTLEERV
jgi:hypothetical protein